MTIFMFKKEMFYHLMEIYDHLFCMRIALKYYTLLSKN